MRYLPLQLFNTLVPKDRGSRRIAKGIAFGREPRQLLDLYAPRRADGPLPVILFIYGGSWDTGDCRDYGFAARALAALGFVVAIADYRLVHVAEYPAFLDDGALALAWIRAHIGSHGGDPHTVVLVGHSAGAYNAMMLALSPAYRDSTKVRAVVGLSGPYDFYPFDSPITRRVFGSLPDPESTQPVNFVTKDSPPVFVGHGDDDRLVYPRNTVALAKKLRAAGVAVTEKHYTGMSHAGTLLALSRPLRGRSTVLSDVARFLAAFGKENPAQRKT